MNDPEKLEHFSADVAQSVQERHDEKRSAELEVHDFPISEGHHYGGQVAPLAEGTTPHDTSDWNNVEPEPSFVGDAVNTPAREQTRLPSFAQSEFYTVNIFSFSHFMCMSALTSMAQIVRRQRRKRGDNDLKMTVSHSRVPHLNAEWEFSVTEHTPSITSRLPNAYFLLLGMGFHALLGYRPQGPERRREQTE